MLIITPATVPEVRRVRAVHRDAADWVVVLKQLVEKGTGTLQPLHARAGSARYLRYF